jgi:hypothetical protein
VIRLVSGILDGGENVFALKAGIILQDLFDGGSCTQQFQDVGDTDSHAANTRTAAALGVVDGDSGEAFFGHGDNLILV